MTRTLFLAALLLLTPAALGADYAPRRPNIVVMLVDDMGFSDVGCYGGELATPNIDRLATNGLRFTQFYNAARCCPTRASLLTGLYPHQAGIGHMTDERRGADGQPLPGYSGRLNDECVTMAEVLRGAGYFTAMTGKWHVGQNHGVTPSGRGFDRSLNAPAGGFYYPGRRNAQLFLDGTKLASDDPQLGDWYSTDLWSRYGLKFVDEARAADKPFFLYVGHNAPHFPLQAPAKDIARWRGRFKQGWDKLRDERYARQTASGLIDRAWPLSPRPENTPAWDSLSADEQDRYDHIMAIYAAVIERMDRAVGALIDGLKERGELDNTLVLFMSDNGGNAEAGVKGRLTGENPGGPGSDVFVGQCWAGLNNTPFVRYKHYTDEGGIATPLIAHWPKGISASRNGSFEKQPGHLIDIMATCVDVAGAKYPSEHGGKSIKPMEGVSLRPAFAGETLARKQPLFWEHEGNRAVRDGRWKLVALEGKPWRLYDLQADRTEQHDLAEREPERVATLAAKWDAYAKRANVLPLGGWRGVEGRKAGPKLSEKRRFELKAGERLKRNQAPAIVGNDVVITATFTAPKTDSVLLAHGGSANGYALFVREGKLSLVVRAGGDTATVTSPLKLTGKHKGIAKIGADGKLSLAVDDEEPVKATGEPIDAMPVDGLDVGADEGGLVGDYAESKSFDGEIESLTLELFAP